MEIKAELTGKFNDEIAQTIIMKNLESNPELVVYNFKYFAAPQRGGFDYNPRLVKEIVKLGPKSIQLGEAELELRSSDHDPWGEVEVYQLWEPFTLLVIILCCRVVLLLKLIKLNFCHMHS